MENSSHNADGSNFEGTADIPDLHATDITVNGISKRRDSIYYFEDGSIVLEVRSAESISRTCVMMH